MSRVFPSRVASVRVDREDIPPDPMSMATALLAASPRVSVAGSGVWRVDARGWERRGGDVALAHALQLAAAGAGTSRAGIGVADVPVAADAASEIAMGRSDRVLVVPSGDTRRFLAGLPVSALPVSDTLQETFRALGLQRISDLTAHARGELEARFGPEGTQAHRLACGEDDRVFRSLRSEAPPEATLALEPPAESLEPLLFVLRHLLARVCEDLDGIGRAAARIEIEMTLEGGERSTAQVSPARPTRREGLLHDLCRAALERTGGVGRQLFAPVAELTIRVTRSTAPDARQGDLFVTEWRDPMAAAAALSRLRARLGENGIVWPAPRADRRPETRNAWRPVEMQVVSAGDRIIREREQGRNARSLTAPAVGDRASDLAGIPGVLRLLPEPVPVDVKTANDRPIEFRDAVKTRNVVAAEGPERLSGDWWKDPYHREYFRICTADGELLWLYREIRRTGDLRWWLHGWWD
jgi:protein ImuB